MVLAEAPKPLKVLAVLRAGEELVKVPKVLLPAEVPKPEVVAVGKAGGAVVAVAPKVALEGAKFRLVVF